MKKVKFCFGIHNHQPVGNFGWVIEKAYQESYLPFLTTLAKYPGIRISLHFSGILWDWMKEHHPDVFALLKEMVKNGQVELLTGAYYEPILPVIPDRDRIGQITMMNQFLESEFGVKPTGMWLAERVWEPTLPQTISKAGIRYTMLDDIHFRYSGLTESQLHGYYVTEDEGYKLALFPISKKLRYAIPFDEPQETVEYLLSLANEECSNIATYADDGEKFGVWPETHEHCFVNGWLERFFRMLSDNLDWIEMRHFGEVVSENPPQGMIYLPTASYSEMNEWAMPATAIERYDRFVEQLRHHDLYSTNTAFIKGGFWRNYLSKYPEANQLHKRMLYTSRLLDQSRAKLSDDAYQAARRHLYAGQCNCAYWHGIFGGLYLPHLRGAIYQELIAADQMIRRQLTSAGAIPAVEVQDFDADGHDEVIVTGAQQAMIISPACGGMVLELDDFEIKKNLVDIVGRHREGYHGKLLARQQSASSGTKSIHDRVLVKEEGLEKLLVEDRYRRGLFIDHFFGEGTTLKSFSRSNHQEVGDFVGQPYDCCQRQTADALEVILQRKGRVRQRSGECQLSVSKTILCKASGEGITARYEITNHASADVDLHFGVELDLGSFVFPMQESQMTAGSVSRVEPDRGVELGQINSLQLKSSLYNYQIAIAADKSAAVWTHPLWTVSLSEGGFEKVHQGTIIVPHWRIHLGPQESWQVAISLSCATTHASGVDAAARKASGVVPSRL